MQPLHCDQQRCGRLALVLGLCLVLSTSVALGQSADKVLINLTASPLSPETLMAGQTLDVVVTATFSGLTVSDVHLTAQGLPEFASGWTNKTVHCTGGCTVATTVTFRPQFRHAGEYDFSFTASCPYGPGYVQTLPYRLVVPGVDCNPSAPLILPEPDFTQGTSNTICYIPMCDRFDQQVCWFDVASRDEIHGCRDVAALKAASPETCVTYGGFEDGHSYGFMVHAYDPEHPSEYVTSATVYSTQDASKPPLVTTTRAWPESGGQVLVRWNAVVDAVSYTQFYIVYRHMGDAAQAVAVDTVFAERSDDETKVYTSEDWSGSNTGLEQGLEYWYCVQAVDAVDNRSDLFQWVGPVVPDATPPNPPRPFRQCGAEVGGICFVRGTTLSIAGSNDAPGWRGLLRADSVQVQVAREFAQYFEQEELRGSDYFTSGWVACAPLSFEHTFDFLATSDLEYIHDHDYLVRVKAKDRVGNVSAWSEVLAFRMDAKPPEEVDNLSVLALWDDQLEKYYMRLSWEPVGDTDGGSGLAAQYVHRSVGGAPYAVIDTLRADATSYVDWLDLLPARTEVCYMIGSADRVGNVLVPNADFARCDVTPAAPVITAECVAEHDGACIVPVGHVRVCWRDFDMTRVARMEIECPPDTLGHEDVGVACHDVPLLTPGHHSIRVRARFVNNMTSPWSAPLSVYWDNSPPNAVTALAVVDTSGVDFRLSWEAVEDDVAVDHYEVRMRRVPAGVWQCVGSVEGTTETVPFDGRTAGQGACANYDSLDTYAHYEFKVVPVDIVGNGREDGNGTETACCNRAPRDLQYEVRGETICWTWQRPRPMVPINNWKSVVRIWLDGALVEEAEVFKGTTYCYAPGTEGHGPGDYMCRVMEVPMGVADLCATAWSKGSICPFGVALPPVRDLVAQPQPFPPNGGSDDGQASLHWTYPTVRPGLSHFHVACSDGRTWDVPYGAPGTAYELCVPDFASLRDYEFRIRVHSTDYHDPSAESALVVRIDPLWAYTPQVYAFSPPAYTPPGGNGLTSWFNSSTIGVLWRWIDAEGRALPTPPNVQSCQLEMSLGGFGPTDIIKRSDWLEAAAGPAEIDLSALGLGNPGSGTAVSWRIRARDAWWNPEAACVHESPWSTDYVQLGIARAIVDKDAPSAVDTLWCTTEAYAGPQSDVVNVHINWGAVGDLPEGNGSGVDHYVVYRSAPSPQFWSSLGTAKDTFFVDAAVNMAEHPTGLLYKVQPVDHVGNERLYDNKTIQYQPPPPPAGLVATSKQHLTWTYAQDPAWFYLECAPESYQLGTPLMRFNPVETRVCVPGSARSFTFNTDANFVGPNHPTIYFHVKALWGDSCANPGDSSPWSAVISYTEGGGSAGAPERLGAAPAVTILDQNHPNPFNPRTEISFGLANDGHVSLQIFNVKGQMVRSLVDGSLTAGQYVCAWDGVDVNGVPAANGIYFYRLRTAGFVETRKMTLMR